MSFMTNTNRRSQLTRYAIEDERGNLLRADDYLDDSSAVLHAIAYARHYGVRVVLVHYTNPADHGRRLGAF